MRHFLAILFFGLGLLSGPSAFADWADPGAAFRCDKHSGTFTIQATMDTSEPGDKGTVRPRKGFTSVDKTSTVRCKLGRINIKAKFSVRGPQATGMCGGITQTTIEDLSINGKLALEPNMLFNHRCFSDPEPYELRITTEAKGPKIVLCYGTWNWGTGFVETECHDVNPANPSVHPDSAPAALRR